MRRGALSAAQGDDRVTGAHLLTSVDELRNQSGPLTATLLGAEPPEPGAD